MMFGGLAGVIVAALLGGAIKIIRSRVAGTTTKEPVLDVSRKNSFIEISERGEEL
jgi:hypothetical protein